ncbi:hypothetical protein [Neisseria yangbaofengii]|uniref:hypothetical protein n=1 Tax=Neisseria yangbaofengii TaxID=2709396 RepID=UPI0013EBAD9A|nr:hypothetical protein [Neisseria yangbaofengii]
MRPRLYLLALSLTPFWLGACGGSENTPVSKAVNGQMRKGFISAVSEQCVSRVPQAVSEKKSPPNLRLYCR